MTWEDEMVDTSKIMESIFTKHELWPYNAFVESDWDLYATGYKRAADYLVEQAASTHQQDFIIYPAMFLYRHYLELRLKEVLLALQAYFGLPRQIPPHHDLHRIWREVRPLMESAWGGDETIINNDAIEVRINEFDQIDKGSFSFRYPVTKDDIPSLKDLPGIDGQPMINLYQVRDVIGAMAQLLDGASAGLSVYLDYKAEMRAEYEAEMRQYKADIRAEYEAEMRAEYEAEMRAQYRGEY